MTETTEKKLTPQIKWQDANPEKRWAHRCLESALKKGLLERKPCEVCGSEQVDGHHDDYTRPMSVRWLCRRHHKEAHRLLKAEEVE